MDIKFETIKELMKSKKYIATDEIVWDVIKGIKKMRNGRQKGQDLYSICLEGPPGAGKSFYAKTYKKVLEDVFDEEVEFIEYQCDSSTGKSDLFEEIRVAAAITGNADEVIISGMLVEAIDAVNSGKKVVLLLDEFEKSRKETDAFMYQFLQDGKIKTTQRGVVEIKPEYKKNLQVILCKNDERELADPLLRRNHIIRLDVMTPKNFIETLNMNLPECDEDIRNIVALLYQKMYEEKDNFAKFPSCSEGMIAVQDACDLLEEDAPAEVIYADILSNLLKHPDDIESFKVMFEKDPQLSTFVKDLQNSIGPDKETSARDEIYRSFFSKEIQQISGMKQRYEKNEKIYTDKIERSNEIINTLKKEINRLCQQINTLGSKTESDSATSQEQEIKQSEYLGGKIDSEALSEALDVIQFSEKTFDDGDPVCVPISIVNTEGSIFDGSDEWYEIMEFEVEEEGWEAIQKFVEAGYDGFRDVMLKACGVTKEMILGDPTRDVRCYYLFQEEEELRKRFFENMLCYDGIVLKDTNESERYKIVAQKQTKQGKNFYKIYSNKRIQNNILFNGDLFRLGESFSDGYIGINGLKSILVRNNVQFNYSKNYLLFSTKRMISMRQISNGEYKYRYNEEATTVKTILPALYLIKEKISEDENIARINDDIVPYNGQDRIIIQDEEQFIKLYESLLTGDKYNQELVDALSESEPDIDR